MATKTRSPNYPYIDLGKAVELAGKLYEKAQRHAMPIASIKTDVWGMTAKSSHGDQSLGAVKAFGLVEVSASRLGRNLVMTTSLPVRL